ncbi:MAG: lipocalin-like domain-containing protein [Nitrosomonas sp.]|nr:lipocalin-like domain-containing protein [Nitrosomonas sp.]
MQPRYDNHKLTGAWLLDHYQIAGQHGQPVLLWGGNASGILIYTDNGYMSVQVSNNDRPAFAQNDFLAGEPDEIRSAFEGYTAYFGRYDYKETNGYVNHHVQQSIFPNWNGVTHTRFVTLDNDKLILGTPPISIKGESCTMQMYWKRID